LLGATYGRLERYLAEHDGMYGRETGRRVAAIEPPEALVERTDGRLNLADVASWAAETIGRAGA
jgi:hypothetical protein